ncbi:MAG: PepSY domain-containing protein [Nitrososphaeraceae archaeon]
MRSRNSKTTVTTTFVLIAIVLVFGSTSALLTTFTHKANAQTSGSSNMTSGSSTMGTNGPKSMMTGNRGANITGSVPLLPTMMQALKSRVHTSLNDATTTALKSVGGNSSAVAGFIHPENGFLVYNVIVLDANNNIHRVIVDAGNGKVLSSQSMSMMNMMMGPGMGMMGPGGAGMGMMGHGMGMMGPGGAGMGMMRPGY